MKPYQVTNVTITTSSTTINISWTVPYIAYTNEQYYVQYKGLDLQPHLYSTPYINGSVNISATNSHYTTTIHDLEEGNTYNISIVAKNCIGETVKSMTVKTLSICEYIHQNEMYNYFIVFSAFNFTFKLQSCPYKLNS